MIPKFNFHTHTLFCDGKDAPEEIVKSAIEKDFEAIGFSGHAYSPFATDYCMSPDNTRKYIEEINRLKVKYSDAIKIYCGIETDYYSEASNLKFDYVIGSVHDIEKDGIHYPVDASPELLKKAIEAFEGDAYTVVEKYYKMVAEVVDKTHCDIIGHFDLITKFNENGKFFSEIHPRYIKAAKSAVDALIPKNKVFEINTGAIARGYRTLPYPSEEIIKYIAKNGGRFIFASDCHDKNNLDCAFEETINLPYIKEIEDKIIKILI